MTKITFISADGTSKCEVEGAPGQCLLEIAQAHDQPLEGACEGAMACSTCHVIVDAEDFAKLPKASAHEEDMLDFTRDVTRTSRLACQIILFPELERLTVRMPRGTYNMQRR